MDPPTNTFAALRINKHGQTTSLLRVNAASCCPVLREAITITINKREIGQIPQLS